ncbi:uncharacterized protein [Littorina saxatilis]|uniref:uncharacterized protein isoform X2 n=1 Tax=Littorina saxatilis TaxID=31220 RepID=UPI0038B56B09
MISSIALLFVCVSVCTAHLCMLSPPQRSALNDINKAGSDSCILLDGPCGKVTPSVSKLFLQGGANLTVVFQKNLDHFNSVSPGYWSVSIGDEANNGTFKELYRTADTSIPSLSLLTAVITVPEPVGTKGEHMVLQTQYVTKNPKAPPVLQCL